MVKSWWLNRPGCLPAAAGGSMNCWPMTKLDTLGDPRLVPLGAIVRATGLHELPQLISVPAGHMSIVGPRPCLPYEYELYNPWQRRRLNGVPGLTGL